MLGYIDNVSDFVIKNGVSDSIRWGGISRTYICTTTTTSQCRLSAVFSCDFGVLVRAARKASKGSSTVLNLLSTIGTVERVQRM